MNGEKRAQVFYEIQELVKSYHPDADLDLIRAAYSYSAQVHSGQTRRLAEPYLVHPVAVASILAQMKLDEASIATGLLHDTLEDNLTSIEDLERFFGKEIAALVDSVGRISKVEFQSKGERQAENFRSMILAMSRDIRVLLVKLADRLHDMRTLQSLNAEAQKRIATETMDIYAPLAGRLGLYWIQPELEDLAFKYVEPEQYNYIKTRRDETIKQAEEYVNNVMRIIEDKLGQYKIYGITKGRTKAIYSIYHKMTTQSLEFGQVHDVIAFRIVLDNVSECYAVLGLIHSLWRPLPGRFKDYIAMPKNSGYQSLHTTVIGPLKARMEIQIRTREMDLVSAHWAYKAGKVPEVEETKVVNWLRQMMEWQQDLDDPREFFENVRVDLYPDEVYVFTPKGEVKEFPKGASPLDFAYAIHTEVGHHCTEAWVNGKLVDFTYRLSTGDTVAIVTSEHQNPSKEWLKYVRTRRARYAVRHYVLAQEREQAIEIGRESLRQELGKWRIDLNWAEKEEGILNIAAEFSLKTGEDLCAAIGYGRLSPKVVVTMLVPTQERENAKAALVEETRARTEHGTASGGVRVQGLTDVTVNFAKCCYPLPGDSIKGFVTRSHGVTIHKDDCLNLQTDDSKRIVEVNWDESQSLNRIVRLSIKTESRTGMLARICGVFSSNESDILEANVKTLNDYQAQGIFMVSVRHLKHLTRIMNALKIVKGVQSVERLGLA